MKGSKAGRSGTHSRRVAWRGSLTVKCLLGLAFGVLVGTVLLPLLPAAAPGGIGAADAAIRAWTNGFRLVVPFLVVAQLYVAVAKHRPAGAEAAKLGLLLPSVFVALWIFVALCTFAEMIGVLALPGLRDATLSASALGPVGGPVGGPAAGPAAGGGANSWIDDLIPPNLLASASGNNILPLMLFALVFALAARRLAPELQRVFQLGFTAVRDAMFVLVDWLVRLAPIMLFAFGLRFASGEGLRIGGLLLTFAAIKVPLLLLNTVALCAVASLVGRYSPSRLARALFPAQLAALTTRSSLATVPALLKASEQDLRIPPMVSSLVVPLAGATLKLSRAVSDPIMLLFLAHVLGIHLGVQQVLVFLLTVLPMGISTPGVPRVVSGSRSVPAYVSVGIPGEYVILFGAVTAITDAFLTLINTTGYMVANILVARWAPGESPAPARPSASTQPGYATALLDSPSAADPHQG